MNHPNTTNNNNNNKKDRHDERNEEEKSTNSMCLLTPKSLSLSLQAPRGPPMGSSHDYFLRGQNPTTGFTATIRAGRRIRRHDEERSLCYRTTTTNDDYRDVWCSTECSTTRRRNLAYRRRRRGSIDITWEEQRGIPLRSRRPYPHLGPALTFGVTRFLGGRIILTAFQNRIRDDGRLRSFDF